MLLFLCTIIFVGMFLLPFTPAVREVIKKEDAAPLFINMGYSKDPRYFAVSFRKLMLKAVGDAPEGVHEITLSKPERIRIAGQAEVSADSAIDTVFYVKKSLKSGNNATLRKEVYSRGDVHLGEENMIKALACDGKVTIGKGASFMRWLDAEGDVTISEDCHLGISATCDGVLSVAPGCRFMRLYGAPVIIAQSKITPAAGGKPVEFEPIANGAPTERGISSLPAHNVKNCNLIAEGSLSVGEHAVIHGHVKSHGKIVLGASAVVIGNLFAEKDIEIGPGSRVYGSVFSQGSIKLQRGVTVGSVGRIKSVIGKKGVTLEHGVTVYGYVATEGKGLVV
ncbi:MAG TPA: polymer-forming cytoskeletal protein [Dissulfurispiraceae bacterium]|nr:polymer-forming cytoskeletal protein [Dissulfurispiraceae bacterium]